MQVRPEWKHGGKHPGAGCAPLPWGCADYCAAKFPPTHDLEPWERWSPQIRYVLKNRDDHKNIFIGRRLDPFCESVPTHEIETLFQFMAENIQHTFILLTSNPRRMGFFLERYGHQKELRKAYLKAGGKAEWWETHATKHLMSNVWGGVTIDGHNQESKIFELLNSPLGKRFIFIEPTVLRIDLTVACQFFSSLDWVAIGKRLSSEVEEEHFKLVLQVKDQCSKIGVPCFVHNWCCTGQCQKFEVCLDEVI